MAQKMPGSSERGTEMRFRVVRAVVVAPVLLAALGGCVYRSKEVERSTPSPVVMAPAPAPAPATVVVPPATTVAPAVPADRVVYPEGRWQLYGDGRAVAAHEAGRLGGRVEFGSHVHLQGRTLAALR